MQILSILLSVFVSISCNNIFNNLIDTPISGDILSVEFSPNQDYLAFMYNTSIQINNGVTMNLMERLFPLGYTMTAFGFSPSSTEFVVGLKDIKGGQSGFTVFPTIIKSEFNSELIESTQQPIRLQFGGQVNFACFTASGSHIVIATSLNEIFVSKTSGEMSEIVKFEDNLTISSIACSTSDNWQFAVSGSDPGVQSKLKIYAINASNNQISLKRILDLTDPNEPINDMQYSSSGNYLYRCGTYAYKIDLATFEDSKINIPAQYKDFKKIRVTAKEDILAVSTSNNELFIRKSKPGQNLDEDQVQSIYNWNFGLAPHGSTVFFIQNQTEAKLASQCAKNQFLSQDNDTCQVCSDNCVMCLGQATSCRSCKQAHYVSSNYQCLGCVDRCRSCINGSACIFCYQPFIKTSNKLCGCEDGQYPNGNVCSNCVKNCKTCSNAQTCQVCIDTFSLNSSHLCECGDGKFLNGNVCSNCVENCKTCSNDQVCQVCIDTLSLNSSHLCECKKGQFLDKNTCVSCRENCIKCQNLSECIECSQQYELENSVCKMKFPVWAIVLLSLIGFGVIFVIVCVVIPRFRRQKKAKLLDEDDSGERLD